MESLSNQPFSSKTIAVVKKNRNEFNFLINSGKYKLKHNNYVGAYSEFKLAKAIYPENEEVKKMLYQTLTILCFNQQKYCNCLEAL